MREDLALAMAGGCSSPREWLMPDRRRVALATIAAANDETDDFVGLLVTLIDVTVHKGHSCLEPLNGRLGGHGVTRGETASVGQSDSLAGEISV